MRNELEIIKKIEEYLTGQMPSAERAEFENNIAAAPTLAEKMKLQQQLMLGIERAAIRQSIVKAALRFKWLRRFYSAALSGFVLIAMIMSVLYYSNHRTAYRGKVLPKYNEQGQQIWAAADSNIAAQSFFLDASKDTVIETRGGIVLSVPANCFLTEDGQPVTERIEFVVKEALSPAAIMEAGLSSKSGADLLESGGMFFIDARKGGKPLRINPRNSIYGQVPTDSVKSGMQLFYGKRMPNGTIDWVKPRPIEHDLVPVDIKSLNFYPPLYLDSLAKWGYDITNKKFTDSLYYSLSFLFESLPQVGLPASAPQSKVMQDAGRDTAVALHNSRFVDSASRPVSAPLSKVTRDTIQDTIKELYNPKHDEDGLDCAINPAKIKAIWNDKFQNTLLSTREFEQRLHLIHKRYGPDELDLYVNNLDKPLYVIDSMVAMKCNGIFRKRFLDFAARHDGKVNITSKQARKLGDYYRIKAKIFADAVVKTRNEFLKRQQLLDNDAEKKQQRHEAQSTDRNARNFSKEFDINLEAACKQLGYSPENFRAPAKNTYNVQITTTGWCNVDRYVYESVAARATLNFTDKEIGKKTEIKYTPVSFKIGQAANFDRLYVYLLPDKLNSFMRVNDVKGVYSERLNELMKYNLVCIGYKNGQSFIYSQTNIEAKDYSGLELSPASEKQISAALDKTANQSQAKDLVNENNYQQFAIQDIKRQKANRMSTELNESLIMLIFPCNGTMFNVYYSIRHPFYYTPIAIPEK